MINEVGCSWMVCGLVGFRLVFVGFWFFVGNRGFFYVSN